MKSTILLFLSVWMVATSSCGIKRSLRDFNKPEHQSSAPVQSNGNIKTVAYLQCALKDHISFESLSVEAVSILKFLFQKNQALFPLFLFLLGFFSFASRQREYLVLKEFISLTGPPLYIRLRRLQYYA